MSNNFIYTSENESQTQSLGVRIGQLLEPGFSIGLNGTLGSGKTRLAKGIAQGLEIDAESVVSPTFTICVPHQGRLRVLHVDAYRINHQEEVDELGLDEERDNGVVLIVEWAEKIKDSLPVVELIVDAEPIGETIRRYTFSAHSDRAISLVNSLVEWSK